MATYDPDQLRVGCEPLFAPTVGMAIGMEVGPEVGKPSADAPASEREAICTALVGGIAELVVQAIERDRIDELPALTEPATRIVCAVLRDLRGEVDAASAGRHLPGQGESASSDQQAG